MQAYTIVLFGKGNVVRFAQGKGASVKDCLPREAVAQQASKQKRLGSNNVQVHSLERPDFY